MLGHWTILLKIKIKHVILCLCYVNNSQDGRQHNDHELSPKVTSTRVEFWQERRYFLLSSLFNFDFLSSTSLLRTEILYFWTFTIIRLVNKDLYIIIIKILLYTMLTKSNKFSKIFIVFCLLFLEKIKRGLDHSNWRP